MTLRVAIRLLKPNAWPGGVNYLLNMSRVLKAYGGSIEPVMFASPDVGANLLRTIEEITGAPPIELRDRSHRDDIAAMVGIEEAASTAAFRAANIDVVFEATGYYGARPPFPTLSWIPDFQHRSLPHFFTKRLWLAREARHRSVVMNRKHIMLSSHDVHADMRRLYSRSQAKVHVAPFAICMDNPPSFEEGERVRLAHGLPERFIFLPNQFWVHKNHIVVIKALGLLAPSERPFIATSGQTSDNRSPEFMKTLTDALTAADASESFRILGHIPYSEVMSLNARADALLNPSLFEGWSTPVEEAKALGTPMVLSNLGVHREQVGDGAIFFDPHDPADCAAALRAAMARPPRQAEDRGAVIARNLAAQKRFADGLRLAFEAVLASARD